MLFRFDRGKETKLHETKLNINLSVLKSVRDKHGDVFRARNVDDLIVGRVDHVDVVVVHVLDLERVVNVTHTHIERGRKVNRSHRHDLLYTVNHF